MSVPEQSTMLSSWKDIARYMGKGVRTVQRWERELGLPVRRPNGVSQKSAVVLTRSELDAWLETHFSARERKKRPSNAQDASRISRGALRENLRRARELRSANLALTLQITQSLRRLSEQCDTLSNLSNPIDLMPLPAIDCPPAESGSLAAKTRAHV